MGTETHMSIAKGGSFFVVAKPNSDLGKLTFWGTLGIWQKGESTVWQDLWVRTLGNRGFNQSLHTLGRLRILTKSLTFFEATK